MSKAAVVRLEGELTIYRAQELLTELQAVLGKRSHQIEIDLSEVTEIDSAGVQLLVFARREALAQERSLRLVGHSPAVVDAFELLDLVAHFGDPIVLGAHAA
jgi:anti-anti-sigma factor